jgi:hypothetical protein
MDNADDPHQSCLPQSLVRSARAWGTGASACLLIDLAGASWSLTTSQRSAETP